MPQSTGARYQGRGGRQSPELHLPRHSQCRHPGATGLYWGRGTAQRGRDPRRVWHETTALGKATSCLVVGTGAAHLRVLGHGAGFHRINLPRPGLCREEGEDAGAAANVQDDLGGRQCGYSEPSAPALEVGTHPIWLPASSSQSQDRGLLPPVWGTKGRGDPGTPRFGFPRRKTKAAAPAQPLLGRKQPLTAAPITNRLQRRNQLQQVVTHPLEALVTTHAPRASSARQRDPTAAFIPPRHCTKSRPDPRQL